ncbi:5-oxoprolinase/urea amidolyase family protein [Flavobacteriaceae bacterium R38]|nr:5-oxoprolinase/urea amidolyase family protein [Flavobacteriaceae bacterium R38]
MIKILKPGFYTSVQDKGRYGYRHLGVPVSGAMDQISYRLANKIIGNDDEAAVLEFTMTGPMIEFESSTVIAITGAEMSPQLNGSPIENNRRYKIEKGSILSFGRLQKGFRGYLAVYGGIQTKKVLKSASYMKNITEAIRIEKNEQLPLVKCIDIEENTFFVKKIEDHISTQTLEVFKGPEYHQLSDRQLESLFSKEFTVAKENNRMAYQLEETIQPHPYSLLTSATLTGTVELTSSGKLIILMRDGQTTGGYPRILQLTEKAIATLAQKKTYDKINFKMKVIF